MNSPEGSLKDHWILLLVLFSRYFSSDLNDYTLEPELQK